MSRFALSTIVALIAFVALGASLDGWTRIVVLMCLWVGYLTLAGCGIAFIQMQFYGRVICHGATGRMQVSLTFDDGPDPVVATPALLDLLRRENIPAAFFCIGKNVAAYPEVAARIAAEGHLLGNHTYNHAWWTSLLRGSGLSREISLTQTEILNATGIAPAHMRPPVGLTNPHYPGSVRRAGLVMVGWDVRSMDVFWHPRDVIERVVRQARDGSIILLHDGGASPEGIVEIVSAVASELRSRGFSFERLDRLISPTAPSAFQAAASR